MFVFLLAGYFSFAQDCGSYIELLGTGISGQSEFAISVGNEDNIVSITAEVIYKSTTLPGNVKLWSVNEEFIVEPVDIPNHGKFIEGVVLVDISCEYEEYEGYCSYTQGYYGNEGGKTCKGESTRELLGKLLYEDLILGDGDHTFTIPAGAVDCVLDILPGGGPSKALTGAYGCDDLEGITLNNKGRLKNSLLPQGITLALNLRNSPDLMSFPVDGISFYTRSPENCKNPESKGIHGTEKMHVFGQDVVDFLGENATIEDLLALVNMALAGDDISPLCLSNVADAANVVNEAFDECVVVVGPADVEKPVEGSDGEYAEHSDQRGRNLLSYDIFP